MKLPIEPGEWRLFLLMLATATSINVIFGMLRSSKEALVVTACARGAEIVPYLFCWGVLPASLLMTWGLARAMRRLPLAPLFLTVTWFFLLFFLLFALLLYPNVDSLHATGLAWPLGLGLVCQQWAFSLYYVMAELWKVAILTVLFWAFVNRHTSLSQAKRLYAPLMVGGSLGALLSGPLTLICSSSWSYRRFPLASEMWGHSLALQTGVILLLGLFLTAAFLGMRRHLTPIAEGVDPSLRKISLLSSLRAILRSRILGTLTFILFADYIAYGLGQVIFLDVIHEARPDPTAYCHYLGALTLWTGVAIGIAALFLSPHILQRFSWTVSALVTPLLLFATLGLFFLLRWMEAPLPFVLAFGSLQFVLCRAAKYTLLDSAKEIALIPLPRKEQLEGKLIIDGITARTGRAASSAIQIGLIALCGSLGNSLGLSAVVAMLFTGVWMAATRLAGREFARVAEG